MLQNDVAKGKIPVPYPQVAGAVVAQRVTIDLVAGDLTLNNILEVACLPGDCRVVDMILDTDDLDTNVTPLITLDVGIMSGTFGDDDAARTCGAEFFSGATTAQAGGVARPTLATAFQVAATATPRSIGIKVAAAAATGAAGTIGLTVLYAAD